MRGDNFVEQREYRSMAPRVVDVNERGGTAARAQGFVPKPMRRIFQVISLTFSNLNREGLGGRLGASGT